MKREIQQRELTQLMATDSATATEESLHDRIQMLEMYV